MVTIEKFTSLNIYIYIHVDYIAVDGHCLTGSHATVKQLKRGKSWKLQMPLDMVVK
jgi:hypothetical protein